MPPRWPNGPSVTAARSITSPSCISAPASAWAWSSAASCCAARTGWPGRSRSCRCPAEGAQLIAKTICAVVTVVDPDLIVLGGGIGRAPGFAEAVTRELEQIAPVMPAIRVSALGTDAVVDGCLAAGTELAWGQVMTVLPTGP